MCLFKQIRLKKQKKQQLIYYMKDFVEGKMSVYDFWDVFKNNEEIRSLLILDSKKNRKFPTYYDPEYLLERVDINKLRDRVEIFWTVKRYFKNNKISTNPCNDDEKYLKFISSIQPNWLEIDEELLTKIVNSAPKELTKKEKEEWCKANIKEMFAYTDKPPMWMQNPEWPIIDGKPLIFKYQSNDAKDHTVSKIDYYFYNPDNGEEVVIEQFD
jgi:hypothetical protein